jgi:FAD/FMN-containing dehydrogenase
VALTGRVVYRDSPAYTEARADWDELHSSYPRVIVFAEKTDDVVNAVAWACEEGLPLRVRSGRHHLEGWSNVSDGIVIDVSLMKAVQLESATSRVTVGAGLTQQEAVAALGKRGFAIPTGGEGTVGLAGATLGGGFGLLTRCYGMTCDNLVAAEVVVPSAAGGAEVVRADDHERTDLLWALRGAGNGNYGVVTSLTYKMYPLKQVGFVEAKWKGFENLQDVFLAWQELCASAEWPLTSVLDHSVDGPHLLAVLAGGNRNEARELLEPLISMGNPDLSGSTGSWVDIYAGLQPPHDSALAQAKNWKFYSQFVTEPYPAEAIDLIAEYMECAPSPASDYFCLSLGGAVKEPPAGGSAFSHRDALFYAEPGAGWSGDANTPKALDWVAEFGEALRPYVNGAYVNVPNADMADWETAYWGENSLRLREIKAKYDPDNVFRYEQSIPRA